MVREMTARPLDRAAWEVLARQYEAGVSVDALAASTGLSASRIRHRIAECRQDDAALRAEYYRQAMHRELVRAESELLKGSVESAVKRMRALNMLMKLEKDLKRAAEPERTPEAEAREFVDIRAELECRFNRLRAARDGTRISGLADEARDSSPQT